MGSPAGVNRLHAPLPRPEPGVEEGQLSARGLQGSFRPLGES
jgi:hypothetical protein